MTNKLLGAVASGHPLTTNAAKQILQAGGNAFDACIAAAFMSSVSEPLLNSLGGGGYLLAKTSDNKKILFDFFVNFPGVSCSQLKLPQMTEIIVEFSNSTQTFHTGPSSIATPGTLKGLLSTHEKLGILPLKEVLKPTITSALHGVELNKTQAYVACLLDPIIKQSSQAKKYFYKNNKTPLKEGDTYKNSDYANYLSDLHNDLGKSLYLGDLKTKLLKNLSSQTILNQKDFEIYRVIERKPLKSKYRDYTILTNPLPSLGGSLILGLLHNLEKQQLHKTKWGSSSHLQLLAKAMIDLEESHFEEFLENSKHLHTFTKGTTHISVSDKDGNMASLSLSNGEGSGEYIPDTGIMLNNMLGEDDLFNKDHHDFSPGERVLSMMSPCIVENEQHKIVIGSGGSKRIRSSLLQVLSHLIDFNKPLYEAIHSPRMNWDGKNLQLEPGYANEALQQLPSEFALNLWAHKEFYFGGAHAVLDMKEAVGDERRGGYGELVYSE